MPEPEQQPDPSPRRRSAARGEVEPPSAAIARVIAPHSAASVVARLDSVESTMVAASSAAGQVASRGCRNASAPQAQAPAASIAPSTEGMR